MNSKLTSIQHFMMYYILYSEWQETEKVHTDVWVSSSPNVDEHCGERVTEEKQVDKPSAKLLECNKRTLIVKD